MLIDFGKFLRDRKIDVRGIIHVGACLGEEYDCYKEFTDKVIWVEANPQLIPIIKEKVKGQPVYNFAICNEEDELATFNIIYSDDRTNPGCSSLLNLKKHSEYYPMINKIGEVHVRTISLDGLFFLSGHNHKQYNVLNMDIQGAELLALYGAINIINSLDVVYTEFATEELYEGCCHLNQLDSFLQDLNFTKIVQEFAHKSWGDVIYIKNAT